MPLKRLQIPKVDLWGKDDFSEFMVGRWASYFSGRREWRRRKSISRFRRKGKDKEFSPVCSFEGYMGLKRKSPVGDWKSECVPGTLSVLGWLQQALEAPSGFS